MFSRNVTNIIRFFMDECLPPIIRDRKLLLYPLFWITYRGKNVEKYMEFKKYAYSMTEKEFTDSYENMYSIGTERVTDMNKESVEYTIGLLPSSGKKSFLDIGCGRGYLLNVIGKEKPNLSLTGVDVLKHVPLDDAEYVQGSAENLPFPDNSFDYVFAAHTIEHVRDMEAMVREMKRVSRDKVIIVTPRQRPYRYTFDMHLNFFWFDFELPRLFKLKKYEIRELKGDWVYVGSVPKKK